MRIKHQALLDWIKDATDAQVTKTGTTRGYLRQIGYGNKLAAAETASRIETVTGGAVTRQALRPNDWQAIWPELADLSQPAA